MTSEGSSSFTDTQVRILEAGISLWNEGSISEVFGGMSIAKLAKRAGVTRATVYSYWPTLDEFYIDVVRYMSEFSTFGVSEEVTTQFLGAKNSNESFLEEFLHASDEFFTRQANDPHLLVRFGLTGKLNEPDIGRHLLKLFTTDDVQQERAKRVLRDLWGREPRAPLTDEHLRAVFGSLLDGLAARYRIDPDFAPPWLYGVTAMALLTMFTRRVNDSRDMYQILEGANSWPISAIAARQSQTPVRKIPDDSESLQHSVRRITEIARDLAAVRGWHEMSMEEIAHSTRASVSLLNQVFGSKAGLGLAVFWMNLSERLDHEVMPTAPIDEVRFRLRIGAEELLRSPALSQSIIMLFSGGVPHPNISLVPWNPSNDFYKAVVRAQDEGDIDPSLDPIELGWALERTMIVSFGTTFAPKFNSVNPVEMILRAAGAPPDGTTIKPIP